MNKIWIDKQKLQYSFDDNIIVKDNRIIINNDARIDVEFDDYDGDFTFEINNSNVFISVLGNNNKSRISYLINNSVLTVQKLVVNNSDNVTIKLNSNGSKVFYNYSNINYNDNNYSINIYHDSPNTESMVVNHGVNISSKKLVFDVTSYVPKNSINSICNQDNKIINLKDSNSSTIKPNLIIDNNMIEASHAAYIGKFKDQDVFYLQSRGLNKKECYDLLLKAYLIGHFDINSEKYLEKINSIGGEIDE